MSTNALGGNSAPPPPVDPKDLPKVGDYVRSTERFNNQFCTIPPFSGKVLKVNNPHVLVENHGNWTHAVWLEPAK